jgi:hypothetical protein
MKSSDTQLIWEALVGEEEPHNAELKGVTCHCNDCMHWADGNKCVAGSIELVFHPSPDSPDRWCKCATYSESDK